MRRGIQRVDTGAHLGPLMMHRGGMLIGTHPVHRGRSRGLGAAINYCRANPPDAATVAIITGRGDSVNLIDCPSSVPEVGPQTPTFTPLAPVYQPPTGIEDCAALGLATSAGIACVQRNTQRAIGAENAQLAADAAFNVARCLANNGGGWVPSGMAVTDWCQQTYGNPNVPAYQQPVAQLPVAIGRDPAMQYHPTLKFENLTSGDTSNLKVGDAWRVSISGGPPNASVVVSGGMNGAVADTPMGTTDANGTFVKQGIVTADAVGMWLESWKTGGIVAGSFGFRVVAPSVQAPPPPPPATPPTTKQPPVVIPPPPAGGFDFSVITTLLTESSFFGIPNWVWLAGGVGVLVYFGGKHGR